MKSISNESNKQDEDMMNHSKISGILWVVSGIILCTSGLMSIIHKAYTEGLGPLMLGAIILAFQVYTYRKTGTVKGVL